jgi:hypothetical protein
LAGAVAAEAVRDIREHLPALRFRLSGGARAFRHARHGAATNGDETRRGRLSLRVPWFERAMFLPWMSAVFRLSEW